MLRRFVPSFLMLFLISLSCAKIVPLPENNLKLGNEASEERMDTTEEEDQVERDFKTYLEIMGFVDSKDVYTGLISEQHNINKRKSEDEADDSDYYNANNTMGSTITIEEYSKLLPADDKKIFQEYLLSIVRESPPRQHNYLDNIRMGLEGILVAIIANIGIAGNLLSMVILVKTKLDLQPFLCRLLVLLVTFDTVFLVTDFLNYSLPLLNKSYNQNLNPILAPKLLIPFSQIALTGSVYTIGAITVERYISCCWPHVRPRQGFLVNAITLGGIVAFSIVYNFTRFLEYRASLFTFTKDQIVSTLGKKTFSYSSSTDVSYVIEMIQRWRTDFPREISSTDLRVDPNYIRYYLLASNCTVMVLFPFVSLTVLNWKIYKVVKNRERFRAKLNSSFSNKNDTHKRALKSRTQSPNEAPSSLHPNENQPQTALLSDQETKSQKRTKEREVTISQILVAIVVMFLICQSFKVILVGYEVIAYMNDPTAEPGDYPLWIEIIICLNHVALAFNAAINIVIYICKDQKFRVACLEIMPKCLFNKIDMFRRNCGIQKCTDEDPNDSTQSNGNHTTSQQMTSKNGSAPTTDNQKTLPKIQEDDGVSVMINQNKYEEHHF